jgi:glycosyltransferase involved in cell wall biosynthesis
MIIEATQTYSPGNVELLEYLLINIKESDIKAEVYLGHDFTFNKLSIFDSDKIKIIKSKPFDTVVRFCKRRSNVLFFCSYPPIVKNKNSLVYFHTQFFLWPNKIISDNSISTSTKFKRLFLNYYILVFKSKVSCFFCQTKVMSDDLISNFKGINVRIVPFYNDSELVKQKIDILENKEFDFFYPSTPDIHKNHFRLFEAITRIGAKREIKLCVTIHEKAFKYLAAIEDVNVALGYNAIINVGRISKMEVIEIYQKSKCVVFPSLKESLGLPLIEASILGCLVLGSDLNYIFNVIENPIVFNPLDVSSIEFELNNFLEGKYSSLIQKNKVQNNVLEIINFFTKNTN